MNRCIVATCNGITEYDDDAQAVLCTTCGVVATQDVLTECSGELPGSSLYFGPTTLRHLRCVGGVLTGQSTKEDRDRRNTVAMHKYMTGLLSKLACPGLAPRAHSLFDQARARGKYRWGRKALLVAGACTAVALRESKKGITLNHLASLMDVLPHSLCRMFTHVAAHLALQVPVLDPVALLPGLQSHLKALIISPNCPLPQIMTKIIQPLPPAPVLRLATSLATFISCLDEASLPGASVPAMACALFILALEGQAGSSLPSYVPLAQELGKQAGASKDLVVGQYRDMCKVIKEWMEDVPWILHPDHPDNKTSQNRRKMSRRDVIAMGLKDVVQFKEDILQTRQDRDTRRSRSVSLDVAENEDWGQNSESSQSAESPILPTGKKRKRSQTAERRSSKCLTRPLRSLTSLDIASLSLLSPSHPLNCDVNEKKRPRHDSEVDDMQIQILTSAVFPAGALPTRLQRLAAARGGECHIGDDELFEQGELESLFRSQDEVVKLRSLLEWTSPDQHSPLSSEQGIHGNWEDMKIWADISYDNGLQQPDLWEQGPIEWPEASSSHERCVEEEDSFDMNGE